MQKVVTRVHRRPVREPHRRSRVPGPAHDRPEVGTRARDAAVVHTRRWRVRRHCLRRRRAASPRLVPQPAGEPPRRRGRGREADRRAGRDRHRSRSGPVVARSRAFVSGLPRLPGPNRTRDPGGETRAESTGTGCVNPEAPRAYRRAHRGGTAALFTFLARSDIDATNWRGEQAIRPAVVNARCGAATASRSWREPR
jgi:hypothetical protein